MTSREEIKQGLRKRTIIVGPKGVGKSSGCVSTAARYSAAGKRVLYIDLGYERGAGEELLGLDDALLGRITYRTPRSYREAVKLFVPGQADLVIVDAIQHLRTIAAEVTTQAMVAVGADAEGGEKEGALKRLLKEDGIAHPAVLPYGKGTGQMKAYEASFFDRLFDMGCDVLVAMNPRALGSNDNYAETLGGLFDSVVELEKVELQNGRFEFRFKVEKVRGVAFNDGKPRSWKHGEDILAAVEAVVRPKPKVLLHCAECNKDMAPADAKPCADAKHNLAPTAAAGTHPEVKA